MFRTPSVILVALSLLPLSLTPSPAGAGPPKGVTSLTGSGSFSHQSLGADGFESIGLTTVDVGLEIGYFVSRAVELAGGVGFTYLDLDGDNEGALPLSLGVRFGAATASEVWPYFGVSVGVVPYLGDGTGDELGLLLPGAEAGLRYFTSPHSSFNVAVFFSRLDDYLGYDGITSTGFGVNFGFSIYLGPVEENRP